MTALIAIFVLLPALIAWAGIAVYQFARHSRGLAVNKEVHHADGAGKARALRGRGAVVGFRRARRNRKRGSWLPVVWQLKIGGAI